MKPNQICVWHDGTGRRYRGWIAGEDGPAHWRVEVFDPGIGNAIVPKPDVRPCLAYVALWAVSWQDDWRSVDERPERRLLALAPVRQWHELLRARQEHSLTGASVYSLNFDATRTDYLETTIEWEPVIVEGR